MKKITELLKKKWLRQTSLTILLVAIIVAIYFEINIFVDKLNVPDIDLTKSQIYSLSDESKDKIKNIDKNLNIQLINFKDYQYIIDFANKYKEENNNITIEEINDLSTRSDIMTKYSLESTDSAIIIQYDGKEKILGLSDLYTYEYSDTSYEEVNLTEEAITNAIVDITTENKPQVYFYITHSTYSQKYFSTLSESIQNDANEVNYLDLLTIGKVPDECACLIIPTLSEDISEEEKSYLIDYINRGGNIVLLQDPNILKTSLPNFQAVMDLYGVSISDGIIMEQTEGKMIHNAPGFIVTEISPYTSLTKNLNMNLSMCLMDTGKITFKDEETLDGLNVSYEVLAQASDTAFLRNDLSISDYSKTDSDEDAANAILGALVTKKIDDQNSSKLIIFANTIFSTDMSITMSNSSMRAISFYNNEDMIVNSVNYLTEKESSITIRKKYGDNVKFAVTEGQSKVILEIIYGIPFLIIIIGYIVWRVRRNKK